MKKINLKKITKNELSLLTDGIKATEPDVSFINSSALKKMIKKQTLFSDIIFYIYYSNKKEPLGFISYKRNAKNYDSFIDVTIEVSYLYSKEQNKGIGTNILKDFEDILKKEYKNKKIKINLNSDSIFDIKYRILVNEFYFKNGFKLDTTSNDNGRSFLFKYI